MRRIAVRWTKADHVLIARAADLDGMDVGTFTIRAALAEAKRVVSVQELISSADAEAMFAALDNALVPTERTRNAFEFYRAIVISKPDDGDI
jgi:uncharacterized protein (DUF1778 family)